MVNFKKKGFYLGGAIGLFALLLFFCTAHNALAAIAYSSSATTNTTGVATTTLTIARPGASVAGDFLIAGITWQSGTTTAVTPPAGWTLILRTDNGTGVGTATYYHIDAGGEGASYVWTFAPADRQLGGIVRYTGVDNASPIDVSGAATGSSTTPTAPAVTTTLANDWVTVFYGFSDDVTFSTPAGMTERYDISRVGASDANSRSTAEDDVAQAVAGSSGTKSTTITQLSASNGTTLWAAQTIALEETGAGGSSTGGHRNFTIPTNTSIAINNGDATTTSASVMLTIGATGATQMVVCNNSNFVGCDWEAYNISKSWTLTSDLGTKTVYALFKSSSNDLSSVVSDTIDLVAASEAAPPAEQPPAEQPPAGEAGLSVGDLIKSDLGSSVYYYGSDSKRHLFPSEKTYKSWYTDWSGVKTISALELQGIALGHNVTVRPGTVLVKIETDPKVYAVEPGGLLRWVPNEVRAAALYGAEWAKKIIDVPLIYWGDYTFGADVATDKHPTGTLIEYAGTTDVYYIQGTEKRTVTNAGFTGNNFQWTYVLSVPTTIAYSTGAPITASEPAIAHIY